MDTELLIKFFSSKEFKNIGEVKAQKIIDALGENSIDVLMADPKAIYKIDGLSDNDKSTIYKYFTNKDKSTLNSLIKLGLSFTFAQKVMLYFGQDCAKEIKQNPFCMLEVHGIGFKKCDQIYLANNPDLHSPLRFKAAITHLLQESTNIGHCYLSNEELYNEVNKLLNNNQKFPSNKYKEYLIELNRSHEIIIENNNIYIPKLYYAERSSAKLLTDLDTYEYDFNKVAENSSEYNYKSLSDEQNLAINSVLKNNVTIITGGPGVGKTHVVKGIVNALKYFDVKYALCSPTGKAADRLSKSSDEAASTIHRLLKANHTGGFDKNEFDLLEQEVVIVDEASMLDINLFHSLLKALNTYTKLVLVGDVNQLPSVGPGNLLNDLIKSELFPVCRLTKIFRQSSTNTIINTAHKILRGEDPDLIQKSEGSNCFFYQTKEENLVTRITNLYPKLLETYSPQQIQIMTPKKIGPLGSVELNKILQDKFNPCIDKNNEFSDNYKTFRVGDKVIQNKNNKNKNVFNGETGIIIQINSAIRVDFNGKIIEYLPTELAELDLAYVITVHKSQGSEYDVVIFLQYNQYFPLLQRKLLYTAVTRSKSYCFILGDYNSMIKSIENLSESKRNTSLVTRLKEITV
jgi:exodeoxyribonuclease V alpha subunit